MTSNYVPLPTDSSSSNLLLHQFQPHHHPYKSKHTARIRFILVKCFIPFSMIIGSIGLIFYLFSSGLNGSDIKELYKNCQDGSCLRWDNVKGLMVNKLGLNSFNSSDGCSETFTDEVGSKSRGKLKILHLIDYHTSQVLMDRWMLHSHDAFSQNTKLVQSAVLWGPGFDLYSNTTSLAQNVANQFGKSDHFDAVLVYFNNDQTKFLHIDPLPWFKEIQELSQQGDGTVIIDRPHEMREMRKEDFYTRANVSLVLAPYAYELFEYRTKFGSQALLVHQPHFIDKKIFYHSVAKPRSQPVIIAGDLGAFYPFRARLADMIRSKILPGWIRGHPGYEDLKTPDSSRLEITAQVQEQQLVDFGKDLGDAKICLVTDSRWGYSVQKYVEAIAAGCLVIGNVPLDRQSDFKRYIVPLSNKDSNETIVKTIYYWLKHDSERIAKAQASQDWLLNSFDMDNYVKDVVKWIRMRQDGQRGLVLPYEFDFLPDPLPLDG